MNGKNRFGVWLVLGASVALAACGRSGGSAASTALCRQDVDCDEGLTCRKGLCVDASSLDGIGGAAGATDASEGGGAPPAAGGRASAAGDADTAAGAGGDSAAGGQCEPGPRGGEWPT